MGQLKRKLKNVFKGNTAFSRFLTRLYNKLPFNNRIRRKRGNTLSVRGVMKKCKITFGGKNNVVEIEKGVVLKHCNIVIGGNNNKLILRKGVYGKFAEFCMQDNGNLIEVDEGTGFAGKIHLACIEGTKIIIGKDCLFSSEIVFRTGDSHSILDMEGNRINFAKDINIGNHVWVGHRVLINKGVFVADNTIIGTGAIVTKNLEENNCVYAGVPAKMMKSGVNWIAER